MFDNVSLSPELVFAIVFVIVASGLVTLWQRRNKAKFEAQFRKFVPDEIEPLVMRAYDIANKAVDQIAVAYGNKSKEEKLAEALKYAVALMKFFRTGNLTPEANRALMEYQKYTEHNQLPPREVAVKIGGA